MSFRAQAGSRMIPEPIHSYCGPPLRLIFSARFRSLSSKYPATVAAVTQAKIKQNRTKKKDDIGARISELLRFPQLLHSGYSVGKSLVQSMLNGASSLARASRSDVAC
jgi:hypothetical protein